MNKDTEVGFDPQSLPDVQASGLSHMRERAILLGGNLDIQSVACAGAVLTATIPLNTHRNSA